MSCIHRTTPPTIATHAFTDVLLAYHGALAKALRIANGSATCGEQKSQGSELSIDRFWPHAHLMDTSHDSTQEKITHAFTDVLNIDHFRPHAHVMDAPHDFTHEYTTCIHRGPA